MSTDSFGAFLKFFRELPTARFDSNEEVWRIAKPEFKKEVVRKVSEAPESAGVTDGGKR